MTVVCRACLVKQVYPDSNVVRNAVSLNVVMQQ